MTAPAFDRAAYEDVRRRTRARVLPLAGSSWHLWPLAALRAPGMPFGWIRELGEVAEDPARALAANDRFATALAWQNANVWETWFGAVRAGGPPTRRRDRILLQYLQRYCAKNETIGSFGSMAWARLDREDHAGGAVLCGSPAVVERRTVHLEPWAVQRLVDHVAASREDALGLPARVVDCATFAGSEVRLPPGRSRLLSPLEAAAVGVAAAGGSVSELLAAIGGDAKTSGAVLDDLVAERVLQLGPAVPYDSEPQRVLRELPDEGTGAVLKRRLRALESKAAPLSGDLRPEEVAAALGEVQQALDADAPPGGGGEATPVFGRTPVYFDSTSTLRGVVGARALEALEDPLALVLDSASWLCAEVAAAVEREVAEVVRRRGGRGRVHLDEVVFELSPALGGHRVGYLEEVWDDFRLRWREAFGGAPQSDLQLASEDLRGRLALLLPPRAPAWGSARQHAPDLMLRPRDRGAVGWVLGEVHLAVNTLDTHLGVRQSEEPEELVELTRHDMPEGRFVPLFLKTNPDVTARGFPPLAVHLPDRYVYWSLTPDSVPAPAGARVFASTGIVVEAGREGVVASAEGGEWRAPLPEVLGDLLTAVVANRFRVFGSAEANPRVTIDDLVVCRRKWVFDSTELVGVASDARLAGWLAEHLRGAGLPRHVFVRSDAERKPVYADLESRRNLAVLAHAVRRAARAATPVAITEMLPAPEELWVHDGDGEAYTSELRMVAGWSGR